MYGQGRRLHPWLRMQQEEDWHDFLRSHPALAEEFEERAGILEYDGGMTRAQAEKYTCRMLRRKYDPQLEF